MATFRIMLIGLLTSLLCSPALVTAESGVATKPVVSAKADSIASPAKGDKAAEKASPLKKMLGPDEKDSKEPVFIKSDSLSLDSKDRIFTYQGNVEIVRGDLQITSDVMIGKYSDTNELQTIVCQGNVVVTKGADLRATANRAIYKVEAARIELTEQPELLRGGNLLAADKITVYVNEDRSEAEGNVRVKVIKDEAAGSSTGLPGGGVE